MTRFARAEAGAALLTAAQEGGAWRVELEAPAVHRELRLQLHGGRLVAVDAPKAAPAERALIWIALAGGGRLHRVGASSGQGGLPVLTGMAEAERVAAHVLELLGGDEGLASRWRPRHDRLAEAPELPDSAAAVLRQVDGERTLVEVLGGPQLDPMLAARVLHRLALDGLIEAVDAPVAPSPDQAPLPSPDEMRGVAVETDLRRWLGGQATPAELTDHEAFVSAFAASSRPAHLRTAPPVERTSELEPAPSAPASAPAPAVPAPASAPAPVPTPASAPAPVPAPAAAQPSARPTASAPSVPGPANPVSAPVAPGPADGGEDDAPYAEAGVGGGFAPALAVVLVAGLLGLVLAVVSSRGCETPPPAPAPDTGVRTATITATPTVAEAPPPAPEPTEVKRAPRRSRRARAPAAKRSFEEVMAYGTPLERARALIEVGDAEAAEGLLEDLRRSSAGKAEVWWLSARASIDLGQAPLAVKHAARGVKLAPRAFESWAVRGSALQFAGDAKAAVEAYQRALRIGPEHPRAAELRSVISGLTEDR